MNRYHLLAVLVIWAAAATGYTESGRRYDLMLAQAEDDLTCVALNVYWEARNQPVLGRVAVAQVVVERMEDWRYPSRACEVVRQGGTQRNQCQFSWYCDGQPDRPADQQAWEYSLIIADAVLAGARVPTLTDALWYHANYVTIPPIRLCGVDCRAVAWIGDHIFYREI